MKARVGLRKGRLIGLIFAVVAVLFAGFIWRAIRQAYLDRALIEEIRRNDVAVVRALLSQGADPNTRSSDDASSFWQRLGHVFLRRPYSAIRSSTIRSSTLSTAIEAAVDRRADSQFDASGRRVITAASWDDDARVIRLLLAHGADANAPVNGTTPLDAAIKENLVHTATALAEYGGKPGPDGQRRAVQFAAETSSPALLKRLLDSGGIPDRKTGGRALLDAMGSEDPLRMMEMLLDAGADPNATPLGPPVTPLAVAILMGRNDARRSFDMVRLLLQRGAHLNAAGVRALFFAAGASPAVLKMLLDAGAKADITWTDDGLPLLWIAIRDASDSEHPQDGVQNVKLLLDHGADPLRRMPRKEYHGVTVLDYAERHAAAYHIGRDILTLLKQAAARRPRAQPLDPRSRSRASTAALRHLCRGWRRVTNDVVNFLL